MLGTIFLGFLLHCSGSLQAQEIPNPGSRHAPSSIPSSQLDIARQLHQEGRLRDAEQAYRAFLATSPPPEQAASAHNNLCLAYLSLGDNQTALEDCREAVRLRRAQHRSEGQAEAPSSPRGLARGVNNLALVLLNLGRPAEAEPLLREALQLNRDLGDTVATVQNLSNLGLLAIDTGNYGQALDLAQEAQTLAEDHRDEPWAAEQVAVAKINRGVVLESFGAFHQALDLFEEVVAEDALEASRKATLRLNIAVLYRNLGDPVRALRELETALNSFRELEDRAGQSNVWLNMGLVHQLNLNQPEAAEEAYRRVLQLAGESHLRRDEVDAHGSLGRLLLEQGRWQEAEQTLQRGLALAQESDDPEGAWSCLEGLGRLALAQNNPAQNNLPRAAQFLDQAVAIIEGQRGRIGAGILRAGYFDGRRSVYEAAVTVRALQAQAGQDPTRDSTAAARGLEIVQKAKARELLESLDLGARLPHPLSAEEIIEAAGNAFLLELFVADGTLYGWSVFQGKIRFLNLGPSEPILASAAALHRRLSTGWSQASERGPEAQLRDLSSQLLGPLSPEAWQADRWLISGDQVLRYLPFEILFGPEGKRLVETTTVSYLPSASSLAWLRQQHPEPVVTFAGFGSPQWQPRSPGTAVQADLLLAAGDLRPLPAAEAELVRSAKYLGGRNTLQVGAAATEEAFRRAMTDGARVVHLATHAVVRESASSGAAIVLSPSGEDDGLLRPEEITPLTAQVDLTVLAACSTALGTEEDSRALSSLTGSLLAAGSSAVLATLWDVGDEATAAFMEQLYFRLGKGLEPAEALRQAKLALLADPNWEDPSLWSAYVMLGNPRPVRGGPAGVLGKLGPPALGVLAFLLLVLAGLFLASQLARRVPGDEIRTASKRPERGDLPPER